MTERTIQSLFRPATTRHGAGLSTADVGGPALAGRMGPILMVSLYEMAGPTFPPHPHAGFTVATYILPESPIGFVNQDTLGNLNRIAPGALHVTVAGRGVMHEEQPERRGAIARGYQIWIDHADDDREIAPYAKHLEAGDAPVVESRGASIRVMLGESNGASAPVAAPTPVRLIDVSLSDGGAFEQRLAPDEAAFAIILGGAIEVAGDAAGAGEVAFFGAGEILRARTTGGPARFTLFAGAPLANSRLAGGPFVASTPAQLARFSHDFRAGAFGALSPLGADFTL